MNKRLLINTFSVVALIVILFSIPTLLNSVYWVSVLILIAIDIILVASLRIISLIGYISLGHVGFMLIGAYGSALLLTKFGMSFWMALIIAGLFAAVLALAIGYPFLKVKGIYFTVLTLLTAETFRLLAWHLRGLTGGSDGLLHIPSPSSVTIPAIGILNFNDANNYYYLTIVIVLFSLFILYRIEYSQLGVKWRAIRDTEDLAQSTGINVIWYKILSFIVACFFAGIAGALFASFQHGLSCAFTSKFGVIMSVYLLAYMVVGGENKFMGPIIGVLVLTIITELARPLREYQPIMIGSLSILVVLFMPGGIIDLPNQFRLWHRKLFNIEEKG